MPESTAGGIRPFRYYIGSKGPLAYAVVTWPSVPALNDLMAKGEVITEAEVACKARELLRIDLVGDDLRDVVDALNLMRVTDQADDALPPELEPYEETIKNVERCVNELSRDLPKVIKAHLKVDTERAVTSAANFNALLEATKDYQRERWRAFGGRPPSRRRESWHCDAVYLMGLYNKARGKSDLLSWVKATSPIVKFIAWAFDCTGNEHHDPGSIAQALNRRNREMTKVRSDTSF
jgi:hypothetical protein